GRFAACTLAYGAPARGSRRGVCRSALPYAGCLHEYAARAGGFVSGVGDVRGDRRAREEIRSRRGVWCVAAVSKIGTGKRCAKFLPHGKRSGCKAHVGTDAFVRPVLGRNYMISSFERRTIGCCI